MHCDQVGSLRVVADESGLSDPDTGFVRFGYRDYDPDTGRFTALDQAPPQG